MSNEIKIPKKKLYIALAALSLIALISSILLYISYNNKEKMIEEYKLVIYNSLLCQFSCPIKEAQFEDQKQLVPDAACIKTCTEKLKANNFTQDIYAEKELLKDDLFLDIDQAINQCKKENIDIDTSNINYASYYSCNLEKINGLKEKYDYLP